MSGSHFCSWYGHGMGADGSAVFDYARMINNDTVFAIHTLSCLQTKCRESRFLEGDVCTLMQSDSSSYCSHCMQTSTSAGRPRVQQTPQGEKVYRRRVQHVDCLCKQEKTYHTGCTIEKLKLVLHNTKELTCALCDSSTLRVDYVCGKMTPLFATPLITCVQKLVDIHNSLSKTMLFSTLPMYLKPVSGGLFGIDTRPLEVWQLMHAGYLVANDSTVSRGCTVVSSPFLKGTWKFEFKVVVCRVCEDTCKEYWKSVKQCDAFSGLRVLDSRPMKCTPSRPCAGCNEYMATQLKTTPTQLNMTCIWCKRVDTSSPLLQCVNCGVQQHAQCVLNAFGTMACVAPSCALCSGHSFRQSSEHKSKSSMLKTYTPHFLFMALYQHVCGYMPINNPTAPIGILYCSKSGAFQKEFGGPASAQLMRRSVHVFWNIMIAVYSAFLSPLSAEIMVRMVMCGDFMLSSLRGVEFVTERIVSNFRAIWRHIQADDALSANGVVTQGVTNTCSFTSSEIALLFRCLLHCCHVTISSKDCAFKVLSVATPVTDGRSVVPTVSAFLGLECYVIKEGTKKRSKLVVQCDMHVAFDVRSAFSKMEMSYLKLIAANAQLEQHGDRNVYMTTIALMRHFDKVDKACAVAVLHGARLVQHSVFTTQNAIDPIVYTNKWLHMGHSLIEERIRDACYNKIVTRQSEDILALQSIHPTMFAKESGVFVNALIHMDKNDALHCINSVCESGFATIVVRHAQTTTRLSIYEVKSLFDDGPYDETHRFDVLLHSTSDFAKSTSCAETYENIATNVSKYELCALCKFHKVKTHGFEQGRQYSLSRLLLHNLGIDNCDMETPFVQTFDIIISTWITLLVHVNSNEGRPPKRAVTFR